MSELDFEARLGGQLRAYAQGGVRPTDRYDVAEAIIAQGTRQRFVIRLGWPRWSTIRRNPQVSATVLVVIVLAVVLAGVLLLVSAGRAPVTPPGSSAYQAIFLRTTSSASEADVDIVAVRPDGQERLVRRLSDAVLPAGRSFTTNGVVSQDGWVAVNTDMGPTADSLAWALIDLAHPAREPRLVPWKGVVGGAWGPHGLFATNVGAVAGKIQVVDAETGASTTLPGQNLPGGDRPLLWAADGSGLLVVQHGVGPISLAIAPVASGPEVPGVPALAPRAGSRWVAAGGAILDAKGSDGIVETQERYGDGAVTRWYSSELAPARLVDASFSADGKSIWILLDRLEASSHVAVIARADSPGGWRIVNTVAIDAGIEIGGLGLAPDDSTLAISMVNGQAAFGERIVTPAAGGATSAHTGFGIGFVPASVADSWPGGGSFAPAPAPTSPAP